MLVQVGAATTLAAPWWFREQIGNAVRRLRGLPPKVTQGCDEGEPPAE